MYAIRSYYGDVGRLIGSQEADQIGDFLGLTGTLHRHQAGDRLGVEGAFDHRGVDDAGRHRVHGHAARGRNNFV